MSIVDSYNRSLNDDVLVNSQETIALVEKLHDKLVESKDGAKRRYYELHMKLGLASDTLTNEFKNPFLEKKQQLELQRYERQRQVKLVDERLLGLSEAMALEGNAKTIVMQSLSIEAEKYLHLGYMANSATAVYSDSADRVEASRRLQANIEAYDNQISSLDLRNETLARSNIGENHPDRVVLSIQTEAFRTRRDVARAELGRLKDAIVAGEKEVDKKDSDDGKKQAAYLNDSTIRIYAVTLQREKEMHDTAIKALDIEIDLMETEATQIRSDMAELNLLKDEIREKESSVRDIMDRLSEISVVASNFSATRVKTIDNPQNGIIVSPILLNYLLFSSLIGGLLGAALAIVIDRADLTFRNPYEIFQKMKVPVICKSPTLPKLKAKNEFNCTSTLVTALDPRSSGAEAFRACRTAMLFFGNYSGAKVYLLSSPSAGDGKSTTVSNLGVSIAQSGKRVCILDADMRRPRQHKHFGLSMKPGILGIEDGSTTMDEIIRPTFVDNLSLVSCGGHSENPGEFVVSKTFKDVLQNLRERFDVVLVDSPPLLPVADATSLSTQVDGVLLVFRIRKGVVLASQRARELLDLVHARMLGVIVNGVDQNPYYNEYGGYGYPSHTGYAASRYYEKQTKEYADTAGDAT